MPLTEETVSACTSLLLQIDELAPQLNLLPPAPDVREILNRPVVRTAYADELNAASLVFHNRRTQEASLDDILMTGDAAPETFDAIADQLYPGYYILKAPPPRHRQPLEPSLSELSADHILISTGDYDKGRQIAPEYAEFPAVKHCTNAAPCDWCQSRGCSCNRMAVCYDLPSGPGLAMKCPSSAAFRTRLPAASTSSAPPAASPASVTTGLDACRARRQQLPHAVPRRTSVNKISPFAAGTAKGLCFVPALIPFSQPLKRSFPVLCTAKECFTRNPGSAGLVCARCY